MTLMLGLPPRDASYALAAIMCTLGATVTVMGGLRGRAVLSAIGLGVYGLAIGFHVRCSNCLVDRRDEGHARTCCFWMSGVCATLCATAGGVYAFTGNRWFEWAGTGILVVTSVVSVCAVQCPVKYVLLPRHLAEDTGGVPTSEFVIDDDDFDGHSL
jgi:hypothetical protein